jgi:hypothetical protein
MPTIEELWNAKKTDNWAAGGPSGDIVDTSKTKDLTPYSAGKALADKGDADISTAKISDGYKLATTLGAGSQNLTNGWADTNKYSAKFPNAVK